MIATKPRFIKLESERVVIIQVITSCGLMWMKSEKKDFGAKARAAEQLVISFTLRMISLLDVLRI